MDNSLYICHYAVIFDGHKFHGFCHTFAGVSLIYGMEYGLECGMEWNDVTNSCNNL